MKMRKKAMIVMSLLTLLLVLNACGSREEIYGKIARISGDRIIVDNGTYNSSNGTGGKTSSFRSDGSQSSYSLGEEIDTAGLLEDTVVRLTLSNRTVTAIETLETKDASDDPKQSGSQPSSSSAVYVIDGQKETASDGSHGSNQSDIDTILVKNKGTFHMRGGTLTKSKDASKEEKNKGNETSALFTASGGSSATLDNTQFTSSGSGANAVLAIGKNTKISADGFDIYTSGSSSSGLDATQGGAIYASEGIITTKGTASAPLTSGSGNGILQVSNTEIRSSGRRSPCILSSGTVIASSLTGTASNSPIALLDNGGKITLDRCLLLGAGEHGFLMQPQGNASKLGKTILKVKNSKLTSTATGSMFYISGLNGTAILENTSLYYENGILAEVSGGGRFTLKAASQTLKGTIKYSRGSSVFLKLTKGSSFKGTFRADAESGLASITLDPNSIWTVTEDCQVHAISNRDTTCRNIRSNGHTVYYNASQPSNAWLKGKTISLPGGGKLTPAQSKKWK